MTKKRFYGLRRLLVYKMLMDSREKGLDASFVDIDRMPRPKVPYAEAWEKLMPLRKVYGMESVK